MNGYRFYINNKNNRIYYEKEEQTSEDELKIFKFHICLRTLIIFTT